jgi:hypothetical protein
MLGKLIVAGALAASAAGIAMPAAASAHDYDGGYYGGRGYHDDGYGDWRARRYWQHRRWEHRRWNYGRDDRWGYRHRSWRGHDRDRYYGDYYRQ